MQKEMSGDNPEILMGKEGRKEGRRKEGKNEGRKEEMKEREKEGREKGTGVPRGRDNELSQEVTTGCYCQRQALGRPSGRRKNCETR